MRCGQAASELRHCRHFGHSKTFDTVEQWRALQALVASGEVRPPAFHEKMTEAEVEASWVTRLAAHEREVLLRNRTLGAIDSSNTEGCGASSSSFANLNVGGEEILLTQLSAESE